MGVQINGDTGNISATKADYSGNVTIGGTLTYEDVTNIDSVGLITARQGIEVGASPGVGASISVDGNAIFSGITTATTLRAPTGIVTSLITNTARATTGIVTTLTATTGIVTTLTTNTLTANSTTKVGSGVTLSPDGDVFATGVCTATSFSGSGANLTGVVNPTLAHAFVFMDSQYFTTSPTKMGFNSDTTNDQSSGVTIDRTNKRFTPTIGGVYQVVTQLNFTRSTSGSNVEFKVYQYKNGSEFARNQSYQYSSNMTDSTTCVSLMSLNGTGDYVEFYANHNGSGNVTMNVQSTFYIIRIG